MVYSAGGTAGEPRTRHNAGPYTPLWPTPRQVAESCARERPPPAEGVSYHAEYAEVGHAHAKGKDVTEGRRPPRPLLPDTVAPEHQKPTLLRGIANTAQTDKRPRCRALSRCLEAELGLDCWHALHTAAARGGDHGPAEA
jgi:hypothetical protein